MIRVNEKTELKYNNILIKNNIKLSIISWSSKEIELSNGIKLAYSSERVAFRNRVNSNVTCMHIDDIYQYADEDTRSLIVAQLKKEYASRVNKAHWNNLSDADKQKKQDHMRTIQACSSLVDRDYSNRVVWNKGKTKDTDDRLMANSLRHSGSGNPGYGKRMSDEEKERKSVLIKSRIKDGTWTPHIHNSRTHRDCSYNGKKFRSSWEAMYASIHPNYEYETVRLEYELNGKISIYIVDFVDVENRILIEIKPTEHLVDAKFLAKQQATIEWGLHNNYTFSVISQQYFIDNYNLIDFDNIHIPNIRQKLARIKHEVDKKNKNTKTESSI